MTNGKKAIKKSERNTPVRTSVRVRKAAVEKAADRVAMTEVEVLARSRVHADACGSAVPRPFVEVMVEQFGANEAKVRLEGMVRELTNDLRYTIGDEHFMTFVWQINAL